MFKNSLKKSQQTGPKMVPRGSLKGPWGVPGGPLEPFGRQAAKKSQKPGSLALPGAPLGHRKRTP